MAKLGSSPEVKEWMREHKEEVENIQSRYDKLKGLSLDELIAMAPKGAIAKARDKLIVGIMTEEK